MILLMSLPSAWQIWLLWSRIVYQLGCSKLGDIPSFTRFYWLLLNWLDSCYRLWWFFPVSLDSFRRIGDPILAATFIVGFSCTFSLTLTVFWISSSKLTLSIIARWYNKTLSLPPAKELSWGFSSFVLALAEPLEVVVVDAVHRHDEGRLELLGLNVWGAGIAILTARIKSLSTTEASSKLCFLMNPSLFRATRWMISPRLWQKLIWERSPAWCWCYSLMSGSHPPSQTVWISALWDWPQNFHDLTWLMRISGFGIINN